MARPSGEIAVHLSISLDEEAHTEICRIASDLNLSAAWLVRRAVSEFVSRRETSQTELPLRPNTQNKCILMSPSLSVVDEFPSVDETWDSIVASIRADPYFFSKCRPLKRVDDKPSIF